MLNEDTQVLTTEERGARRREQVRPGGPGIARERVETMV